MKRTRIHHIMLHFLFWALYTLVFNAVSTYYQINFVFPNNFFITVAVQIILVYVIRYYIFNRYYRKGKPVMFFFISLSLILYFIPVIWIIAMISYGIDATFSILFTIDLLIVYLITMVVAFVSVAIMLLREKERWKSEQTQFEKEKKEMELFALRNQIDSHFIFNTLNNIYGLALKKSDRTPQCVLLLSEILSFVIYETKNDFYPLSKEIQLIRSYIELQKIRFGDTYSIYFEVDDIIDKSIITPLILFTFLENSFKHGVARTGNNSWVKIKLKSGVSEIFFEIENSIPENPDNSEQAENKGIGLENIRRRLTLLYPNMYKLITRKSENSFYVGLSLFKN